LIFNLFDLQKIILYVSTLILISLAPWLAVVLVWLRNFLENQDGKTGLVLAGLTGLIFDLLSNRLFGVFTLGLLTTALFIKKIAKRYLRLEINEILN
jgi:cell shape-determining protein MreD